MNKSEYKPVSFKVRALEANLIDVIATRAEKLIGADYTDIVMDLRATIAQGQNLDLQKLLDFNDFNFQHDILGITRHINTNTGKLENFFLPRCGTTHKDTE